MLIPVLYAYQKLGMVYPNRLDRLIRENKILAFRRSTGRVFLDEDSVRKNDCEVAYSGPERRRETTCFKQFETILKEHEIVFECAAEKTIDDHSADFVTPSAQPQTD